MSRRAVERLEEGPTPPAYDLLAYPNAGHFIATPPGPNLDYLAGVDVEATTRAREDAWQETLEFLAGVG